MDNKKKPITVYVFSIIPNLSEILKEKCPKIEVKAVKFKDHDVSKKYEKIVNDEEYLQLENAEIILGDGNLIMQTYEKLTKTKWIQLTWAGVEGLEKQIKKSGVTPSFPLTRLGTSSFSQLMAEYTVGWILNYERGWLDARQYQLKSQWAHKDNIACYRSLRDLTVGVLGIGLHGAEVIRALKFFNCTVYGLGRSKEKRETVTLDKYFSTEQLPSLLSECDYIVNVLPSTPATRGLLGGDILKKAKKNSVFINIGRGDIISEEDVITALDNEWIAAAILDVFVKEPLPSSSLLWTHPKILLTPHAAGVSRAVDVVDAFSLNFENYLEGKPFCNLIDWEKGY